jgi:hypothetical protein
LENLVGKSQRTNAKIVVAREGRETFNILFVFCRAGNSRRRLRRRPYANGWLQWMETTQIEKYVGIVHQSQILEVSVDDAV